MDEKKRVYEADTMALPPLRMVLGDVPSPDPAQPRKQNPRLLKEREMIVPVKRLIAHLEGKK
ncbi:MAG TPA: hypothetical protein VMC09_12455 [Anaerolineales bacterium]|nr:hypothetical protein [Anaerolineales bacterium]